MAIIALIICDRTGCQTAYVARRGTLADSALDACELGWDIRLPGEVPHFCPAHANVG